MAGICEDSVRLNQLLGALRARRNRVAGTGTRSRRFPFRLPFRAVSVSAVRADVQLQHRLMHGFADVSRLRLLDALRDGERRVVDLSEQLALSRPNTSKHLACLHGCGLIERERRGREVYCRLSPGVAELLDGIDGLLERVGDRVASCALTTRSMEGTSA
jgi:ArsR family transcriptional regulator, cadmium/lead-responsive transcriptional repressor